MISVNNLCVEFSAKPLFKDISFVINENEKIALTGKNGAGKSTLLKLLAGLQQPTSGTIAHPSGMTIGYLPQQMAVSDSTSLLEETRSAFGKMLAMKAELEKLNDELVDRTDYESESYRQLIERVSLMTERVAMEGSVNMEAEIERTLMGLGFRREDFARPTSEFSGGWRMRIELAKLLLQHPDLLLLDEPTNHLDIESIQWLESFLKTKARSVLVVSHDRAFLDNVTGRTIEINCGAAYDYKVNYSRYVELRRERISQQLRAYENQQKQIADIKDFIERFRYKATKAVQVQSRIKQLEKIVPIEVDEVDRSHIHLRFPPAERCGDFPLIVDDLSKAYGDHTVFSGATFTVRRGEKIAFVGRNGEGKSTLVKCIMGEIPYEGTLRIGHNVKIGYFAQNQASLLDGELTVFDTIDRVAVGDIRTKIRDLLGAFLFGGEDIDKRVGVLSGGERTRLAMIKLLLEPVNFLILDEPTNHLDMRTKDILKNAIKDFNGTVIVVSHDREFLNGLVDKVYEFGGGRVKEHLGGIYDFLRARQLSDLKEIELTKPSEPAAPAAPKAESAAAAKESATAPRDEPKPSRLSYAEQKEREKILKKTQKKVAAAEAQIESLEVKLAEMEGKLSAGECDSQLLAEYESTKKELENSMSLWELAQQELDTLTD